VLGLGLLFWADLPRSFAWGGREGHYCEHVGALTPVIYDASTRPVVVDSLRRGPYKQPMQVSERGQYSVDGSAAAWPASMDWPLNGAPSAHPKAEQRESKLEGEM
jgi:hypothetical protein